MATIEKVWMVPAYGPRQRLAPRWFYSGVRDVSLPIGLNRSTQSNDFDRSIQECAMPTQGV